jgi:hypothetical protein
MSTGVKVNIRDRKFYTGPIAKVFGVGKPWGVSVGVFGPKAEAPHLERDKSGEKKPGKLTVEEIARAHELGIGVPQRSFIAAWYDAHVTEAEALLYSLTERAISEAARRGLAIDDRVKHRILLRVGLLMQGGIQAFISSGQVKPALSPKTIARKGSSVPLVDSGQLRASITVAIDTGDGDTIAPDTAQDNFATKGTTSAHASQTRQATVAKASTRTPKVSRVQAAKASIRTPARASKGQRK